jgi:hypothetical protein
VSGLGVLAGLRVKKIGAVAQLGEHLLCKQGVSGSIPLSSTMFGFVWSHGLFAWRRTPPTGPRIGSDALSGLFGLTAVRLAANAFGRAFGRAIALYGRLLRRFVANAYCLTPNGQRPSSSFWKNRFAPVDIGSACACSMDIVKRRSCLDISSR